MAYLLQQLLSESANRCPEKTAVWAREHGVTYQELDEQSNQLAHLLLARGVKKGDRIGLLSPKSVELIVCLIGVLKAGGVYVPLDPQCPTKRTAYIVDNCGIKALITDKATALALNPTVNRTVEFAVLIDAEAVEPWQQDVLIPWAALCSFPHTHPLEGRPVETDLAYILYTSGSTGEPKGVMLSHRNALTFIDGCADTFQIRPDDRLSNHAPLHFDLSVFDIFNSLKAGATVCMVPEEVSVFPASLAAFIEAQKISVWYSVPSALVHLLLHGNLSERNHEHLRLILFAGEVFPMKYLRELSVTLPGPELYNLYGPTETNVCAYYRVERSRLAGMDRLPIGKACANTEVFAVNELDELIKPGEIGELYVRGPSMTSGYWGDPQKTTRVIVPNRFQPHFEEKIYRTGDLVTLDDDGNYYFIGRRDSMVKSRGYRIELGEIEAALYSHAAVREAVAIAIPDEQIGNKVKAILVTHQPGSLTKTEVQQHCVKLIPKYMVPELIEFCESLPKTSTGKVDRTQLTQRE